MHARMCAFRRMEFQRAKMWENCDSHLQNVGRYDLSKRVMQDLGSPGGSWRQQRLCGDLSQTMK